VSVNYQLLGSPINKTASRVVSSGVAYEPTINSEAPHWEVPPITRDVPDNAENLIGTQKGWLTVVGLLPKKSSKQKPRWLVRCLCGAYECRSRNALFNPDNKEDRCKNCKHSQKLKRRDIFRRTGKWEGEE